MEQIRKEVFELSIEERAALAHDLVASLDGQLEAGAVEQWDQEILRRLDEVESGNALVIDRNEFSRRLRERIARI
jgi:putative addiction module component (TIGR02574 family)